MPHENGYIYMYGQVMSTYAFLLSTDFPAPDGYGEISEKNHLVGGETGTAAAVLCSLGAPVKLGGTHLGNVNKDIISDYFADKSADISELAYEDFEGIVDYVIIDKNTRTCFGEWSKHFSRQKPFYEPPREQSVQYAVCVGADPYFGDDIARLCVKYSKSYVTVDCAYDSYIHKHCAVNCISHQHLDSYYADKSYDELFKLYTDSTDGLVIFTLGEKGAMYGRKGDEPKYCGAFKVNAVSTLGAGDSFKAGAIYGLYRKMDDDSLVRFACAVAAVAISEFPIALKPPKLEDVQRLLENGI
ncbi:MAG: carbohydrate kinase family protein [Ruminococcus sp.]|nr:carbohydrate kinase family protein [Ruminococcus sp.]